MLVVYPLARWASLWVHGYRTRKKSIELRQRLSTIGLAEKADDKAILEA